MTELCQLAETNRVDKCPAIYHSYTPEYHRLLQSIRNTATKIVEIGIGNESLMVPIAGYSYKIGASLRMWREYFPNASIIGCDILATSLFDDEERISTYLVDQSRETSLSEFKSVASQADLILDDGSHVEHDMKLSFKVLWDAVKVGGFYIIEDIHNQRLPSFETLPSEYGFTNAKLVASYSGNNRPDDNFVAFQKV
jgi:hypothetical protein